MEKKIVSHFEMTVPKAAKNLAKFAGKDIERKSMMYICIEPARGIMAASDCSKLQVLIIKAAGQWPDNLQVLVDPKHIAKAAGKAVKITVSEQDKEITSTRTDLYGRKVTTTQTRTFRTAEIEAGGQIYETELQMQMYPNVLSAIPTDKSRNALRLTAASVEALKSICKLHEKDVFLALSVSQGSRILSVYPKIYEYTVNKAVYALELSEPAETTVVIGFCPHRLSVCLEGCDGAITYKDESRAVTFEGVANYTVLMPRLIDGYTTDYIRRNANNSLSESSFADDAKEVVKQLKERAAGLFESCKGRISGCTAKDIAKEIASRSYILPEEEIINVQAGNIRITYSSIDTFAVLAAWEGATNSEKSVFADCDTVRAKVLQYKADGNTLSEKWETLKKFAEGVYYRTENEYGYNTAYFIFESDGFFWDINGSDREDYIEQHRQEIMMYRKEFEGKILSRAEKLDYINLLEIEIMRRLGHDIAPLIASRKASLKRREEEERKAAEDKARREQERKEAEQQRKAGLLADGKEKLMANKAVTVEQIELMAEAVGYIINVRTVGFMRKKVSKAALNADETVTVWGNKLTSRNISGTADVIQEIAARIQM